jgi:hypothetical protein
MYLRHNEFILSADEPWRSVRPMGENRNRRTRDTDRACEGVANQKRQFGMKRIDVAPSREVITLVS